jgi:hypothetical protein
LFDLLIGELLINWILLGFFIRVGIVLIGVVMSGVWEAQCGEFLIGWLDGNCWIVSMIIPRLIFRSKVPKCKSQDMSLLDWMLLTPTIKNAYLKKSVELFPDIGPTFDLNTHRDFFLSFYDYF